MYTNKTSAGIPAWHGQSSMPSVRMQWQLSQVLPNHPFYDPTVTVSVGASSANLVDSFKPKRAGRAKSSHVVLILDESSSMRPVRESTISAVNEFIKGQQDDVRQSRIPTKFSLYKFNGTDVKCVVQAVDVLETALLTLNTYDPSGYTNLLDAIGGVMMSVDADLKARKKEDRGSVMIVTVTDGEENTSRTFNKVAIRGMIKKAEAKNWSFMFLGANIDAFTVGASLGFQHENTLSYNTKNMSETMTAATRATSSLKHAIAEGQDLSTAYASAAFTVTERQGAGS